MKPIHFLSTLTLTALAASTLALEPSSFSAQAAAGGPMKAGVADSERPAKALPTYFLDQAGFEAAAPGLVSEDFTNANVPPSGVIGCGNPVSSGNPCFAPGGLADGLVIAASSGEVVALGSGLIGTTTPSVAADLFADSTILQFTAPDVYAVGVSLGNNSGPESLQIHIEGFDGSPLDVTSAPVGPAISFWGVLSPAPIGKITLTSPSRAGEIVERVQFGDATLPVPVEDFENGLIDSAWTLTGIGHANQEQILVVDDGGNAELALTSDGATAYLGADNAGFLYQEVTGDFRIETDLDTSTMTQGKAWRKAGLMVRASLDHWDARLLMMQVPLQGRLQFVAREVYGGPGNIKVALETAAPSSLRIAVERTGEVLTVEYSLDGGTTWIRPTTGLGGSIAMPSLPPTLYVGPAVVSNNISVATAALFDNISIRREAP